MVTAVQNNYLGDTHSVMSEPIGITYVGTPDITTRNNKAAGIELGWDKIKGATGYAIYRKPYGSDTWKRIATITDLSQWTYVDTEVKSNNGSIYKYTIRALARKTYKIQVRSYKVTGVGTFYSAWSTPNNVTVK